MQDAPEDENDGDGGGGDGDEDEDQFLDLCSDLEQACTNGLQTF